MLKILQRIVQEINLAHDFNEALHIMVSRVREAIETQACTVFLLDRDNQEFVLMATDGLNPDAEGKIRIKLGQGLVGLVAEREEPINLEDAPAHPSYRYFPEAGEERYRAFLGVPIIHNRQLFGVLIVQQQESRRFDESEEAFLVTISAQLAGIIAHAHVTGVVAPLLRKRTIVASISDSASEICLKGIPSSPGVAIGHSVVIYPAADLNAVPDRNITDIDAEIELFNQALLAAREEIHALGARLAGSIPEEEQALFDVYQRILESAGLGDEVYAEIRKGQWAQGALRKVIKRHVRHFETLEDPYLRERVDDIRDLGLRVLAHLQEEQQPSHQYEDQTILIGEEISAAALAEVPEGKLAGIVSGRGSSNSHVAILARALGVPAVMGVEGLSRANCPLDQVDVIVDAYYGQIYISPSPKVREHFKRLAAEERELDTNLAELRGLPAVTPDGHVVSLFVNTGLAADAGLSLSVGAEGVGLYRTEVPFMVRESFPAEEEQRVIYRQLLNAFAPRPVIMRTLDIGGDKILPYFPIVEENPALGWRGIRVTLDHPDVFLVQIRAMLKASVGFSNLRIMFPMVSTIRELEDGLELVQKAYHELREEGFDVVKPPIGVMIEVPSAVYQISSIARRVDFLSVGSNDLTQYILAVDRNNGRVASLYDALHPAVLYALLTIVEESHAYGKQVSLCGEMANDPAAVVLLLAMGFNALSMNSAALPRVKWIIRSVPLETAREVLDEVLGMENPQQIRERVHVVLDEAGVGGLIRAGL